MKRFGLSFVVLLLLVVGVGCTRHTIESHSDVNLQPVEIKPIHITIDVNIRVDRALDDFFGDLDKVDTQKGGK